MPKKFQLSNLAVGEVSLVDRAAIKRNFSVIKADDSEGDSEDEPVEEPMADKDKTDDPQAEKGKDGAVAQKDDDSSDEDSSELTDAQKTSFLGKLTQFLGLDTPSAEKTPDGDNDMAEKGVSKADLDSVVKKAVDEAVGTARKADQEEITSLQDNAARREFADHVTEKHWGGNPEENINLMLTMKKALSDEDYTKWLEREDTRAAQVEKSTLFDEIGTHLARKSEDGIEAEVEKARKDGDGYDKIVDTMDPQAYMEYQKEQDRRIKRSYLGG